MRRLAISALLSLLFPLCAAAQATEADSDAVSPRVTPAFGLHYGTPLRISGALGVIVDLNKKSLDGVLLLVEPGQQGIEYSAGYLRMIGNFGSGFSVRGSVLHTYDEPWKANPRATYAGGELHWMVALGVGGRAGLFRRVSGTRGEHDTLATIGASIGL